MFLSACGQNRSPDSHALYDNLKAEHRVQNGVDYIALINLGHVPIEYYCDSNGTPQFTIYFHNGYHGFHQTDTPFNSDSERQLTTLSPGENVVFQITVPVGCYPDLAIGVHLGQAVKLKVSGPNRVPTDPITDRSHL